MSKAKELEREIGDLEKQAGVIDAALRAKKAELRSLEYGLSVGDKVRDKKGREGIVHDFNDYFPRVRLFNKGGSLGERYTLLYDSDGWKRA